jgi:alpha-beta hydrolase superfamily lysophospholipase
MTAHDFSFEWQTQDQVMLKGRCWLPEQPKALVCLVHGFAEHMGRYTHVAEYFNAQGYGLIGFDLRGHGQSGGRRGHTPSYDDLIENIREMLALAAEKLEGLPLFLYGHSMGGNLVANYLIRPAEFLERCDYNKSLAAADTRTAAAIENTCQSRLPDFSATDESF